MEYTSSSRRRHDRRHTSDAFNVRISTDTPATASSDESKILILYAGGTIGMLHGPRGYTPCPGFLLDHLRNQPRFHSPPSSHSIFNNSYNLDSYRQWSESRQNSNPHSTTHSATNSRRNSMPQQSRRNSFVHDDEVKHNRDRDEEGEINHRPNSQGKEYRAGISISSTLEFGTDGVEIGGGGGDLEKDDADINRHQPTNHQSHQTVSSPGPTSISNSHSPNPPVPTLTVHTSEGSTKSLECLVTPRSWQGKKARYAILEYEPLIDSSEVELSDWIRIAKDIEANYTLFDAFICLHGTDTMAYTASALSFLLEDLGKTVMITGAQIPLSDLRNDAVENLLGALTLCSHYLIPEVTLYFNDTLLRGNRSTKQSSVDFDAFLTPNFGPLVKIGLNIDVDWDHIHRPTTLSRFRAHKSLSDNVATLRMFPGITPAAVKAFLAPPIQGVVLETYGAGNAPRRKDLIDAFREATTRGVIIVNITQCAMGSVSDLYEAGKGLRDVGVVAGEDMTVEAALAKLSYLLSKPELTPSQIRNLMSVSLRGELTPPVRNHQFSPNIITNNSNNREDRLKELFSIFLNTFSGGSPVVVRGLDVAGLGGFRKSGKGEEGIEEEEEVDDGGKGIQVPRTVSMTTIMETPATVSTIKTDNGKQQQQQQAQSSDPSSQQQQQQQQAQSSDPSSQQQQPLIDILPSPHLSNDDILMVEHDLLLLALGQAASRNDDTLRHLIDSYLDDTTTHHHHYHRSHRASNLSNSGGTISNSNFNSSAGGGSFFSSNTLAASSSTSTSSLFLLNTSCNSLGQTALHIACTKGISKNVAVLLERGASVHIRDLNGNTPLFVAAKMASRTVGDYASGRVRVVVGMRDMDHDRGNNGDGNGGDGGGEKEKDDEDGEGNYGSDEIREREKVVEVLRSAGAHLGDGEISRGEVGLEIVRCEREGRLSKGGAGNLDGEGGGIVRPGIVRSRGRFRPSGSIGMRIWEKTGVDIKMAKMALVGLAMEG